MVGPGFFARCAREWVAAWNAHDLEAILEHYDEDIVFSSPLIDRLGLGTNTLTGKTALRAYFTKGLQAYPDLHFELLEVHEGVDSMAVHFRSVGGRYATEYMAFGPGGKVIRVDAHYAAAEPLAPPPSAAEPAATGEPPAFPAPAAEPPAATEPTLDPPDWTQARALGHRIIDDAVDFLATVRQRRVWTPIPDNIKTGYADSLPQNPTAPEEVYAEFLQSILPYAKGNIHPRFFSWVEGTGTFTGALADLLAAVMNANCAIGDHSAMYIDGQVVNWCKEMLDYPREAGGLLVSGGSMANLSALAVARESALEKWSSPAPPSASRPLPGPLTAYGSTETHNCVSKALRLLGLGLEGFCAIPVDEHFRIRTDLLIERIHADRAAGKIPFCIIGNAGTVNTGAIDPLDDLRAIARAENSWLHIDGAFGALAKLVPSFKKQLSAIEQADSVAFDLHKWMYMPYEVGGVLVRDAALQRRTFSAKANYLLAHERGLAAGPEAYTSKGIELSRGFKALKVWMSLKEHGVQQYARQIECNIAQAAYLAELINAHPTLELLAEVTMNIVCFRYNPGHVEDLNALNKELLMQLHESGIAAPSYTVLHGRYAIRVAITNHRTRMEDMDILANAVVEIGSRLAP